VVIPVRRRILPAVLALLLAAALPTVASAQSEEEVEESRRELDQAQDSLVQAESALASFDRQFAEAISRYEAITVEVVDLTYGIALREDTIRGQERQLTDLRVAAREAAVDAYAESSNTAWALNFDAGAFEAAAISEAVLARNADRQARAISNFDDARSDLRVDKEELDAARGRVVLLRSESDAMVTNLEVLVADAMAVRGTAAATQQEAVAAHELAVEEWEALKNSVSPGALAWKDLVETYFRDELVWEALQVLDCESRGNPNAMHPASGASGLFQFLDGTWILASALSGHAGASPFDPEANVASAAWLLAHSERVDHPRGRWGHWVCQPIGWETPPLLPSR
jgi:hypothetical protein